MTQFATYENIQDARHSIRDRHWYILFKIVQGHTPEEAAKITGFSVDLVRHVMEIPCNKEFIRTSHLQLQAAEEFKRIKQNSLVEGALDLGRAVLDAAMEYDDEGNPVLKMQTKNGVQTPVMPASTINKMLESPLDHDPMGRFTKRIDVTTHNRDKGLGGGMLMALKKEALMEGFTPPQVMEAEFEVIRDGVGVREASAQHVVDLAEQPDEVSVD